MPFTFPIFNSTLLFERGTLITFGILSSIRPRLGFSRSTESISIIFSVQMFDFVISVNPRKGCTLSPFFQTHIGILPACWVSSNLQSRPSYDARHVPLRISCCRIFVFRQVSHDSLEIAWSHLPFRPPYSGTRSV